MCFNECFIINVYLAIILIQNDKALAQSSGDPCLFHDVMDRGDIVRYADSISGSTCPLKTVSRGWYRFGSTGTGEIITSCPTGNQCGGGNRIWINGPSPVHYDGLLSRVACVKDGTSCCYRTLQVLMKSCGSYFIYNIGQFIPCSIICLEQTTAIVTTNPTSAATMITQNTVTTSSMTNRYPTGATMKVTSILMLIFVGSTCVVISTVLVLVAIYVIQVLRRRCQQNATRQASSSNIRRGQQNATRQTSSSNRRRRQRNATYQVPSSNFRRGQQNATCQASSSNFRRGQQNSTCQASSSNLRRDQPNATNQDSPVLPISDDYATIDDSQILGKIQLQVCRNQSSTTFSTAAYHGYRDFGSDNIDH